MKFNVIIGNPPYNINKALLTRPSGRALWPKFIRLTLSVLMTDGYLGLVHPGGWRKPESKLWKILAVDNQINYLEIHNVKDGHKTFNCGTRYDWYVLQKTKAYKDTIVIDEKGVQHSILLAQKPFLPNYLIPEIYGLMGHPNCDIIHSGDYSTVAPRVSRTETKLFKHPIVLGFMAGKTRFCYSSEKLNHFGIPKVICLCSRSLHPLLDTKGKYGMNAHVFGIPIISAKQGKEIIGILNSKKFGEIVKAIQWSNFQISWKFFTHLKKEFWKEL